MPFVSFFCCKCQTMTVFYQARDKPNIPFVCGLCPHDFEDCAWCSSLPYQKAIASDYPKFADNDQFKVVVKSALATDTSTEHHSNPDEVCTDAESSDESEPETEQDHCVVLRHPELDDYAIKMSFSDAQTEMMLHNDTTFGVGQDTNQLASKLLLPSHDPTDTDAQDDESVGGVEIIDSELASIKAQIKLLAAEAVLSFAHHAFIDAKREAIEAEMQFIDEKLDFIRYQRREQYLARAEQAVDSPDMS